MRDAAKGETWDAGMGYMLGRKVFCEHLFLE